jgi:tetratricopeptide (TPR) repeat protein
MRRFSERERIARVLSVVLVSCGLLGSAASLGCEQIDARNRNKKGIRLFQGTQFADAAAEFQKSLTVLDDPVFHYNLGLAYSKITKTGFDGPVLLGQQGDFVCQQIPGTKIVQAGACVKEGDRHYAECGHAKTDPLEKELAELNDKLRLETDEGKKTDLKNQVNDKQQELARFICSSSFRCVEGPFCSLTSPELADLAAQHLQTWIKAQPSDESIKSEIAAASAKLDEAKKADNKSAAVTWQRVVDDLSTKDQTRKLMTLLWTDSDQYRKALDYWEGLLKDKPNDTEIMGNLAGINLKAGDWRKSIEWYDKVAEVSNDPRDKVAEYNFIGNVAWSKLNSRTLVGTEAVELADRGLGALQRGAALDPKNPRLVGLQGSIFNFRSTAHGASWAAAIDRASAQELAKQARVLAEEAKKAKEQSTGAPGTPAPATPPAGSAAPPATPPAGSAASAAGSAAPASPPAAAAPAAATPPATGSTPGAAPSAAPSAPPAPAAAPTSGTPAGAPEGQPAQPAAPPAAAPTPPAAPPAEVPATPPAAPAPGSPTEKSGG